MNIEQEMIHNSIEPLKPVKLSFTRFAVELIALGAVIVAVIAILVVLAPTN
jgi:hypothetical protein